MSLLCTNFDINNESTGNQKLRDYYIYGGDIDKDGLIELQMDCHPRRLAGRVAERAGARDGQCRRGPDV